MKILYCTGNEGKFKEASFVFAAFNEMKTRVAAIRGQTTEGTVEVIQVDADPVEVQGTAMEVGLAKVNEAVRILRANGAIPAGTSYVVTEDVGLNLRCLNGFPGPYCKPMLDAIGDHGLWELVRNYDDKHACVTCTLAAVKVVGEEDSEGDGAAKVFTGTIEGAVLGPPRGDVKHGKTSWNSVFTPDGHDKTFGELQFHEQAKFSHRRAAILKFLEACA